MFDQEQEHLIITALRSNTALTVLCLPGISEHGATHLAPALEHNQIVSLSFYSEWKTRIKTIQNVLMVFESTYTRLAQAASEMWALKRWVDTWRDARP